MINLASLAGCNAPENNQEAPIKKNEPEPKELVQKGEYLVQIMG